MLGMEWPNAELEADANLRVRDMGASIFAGAHSRAVRRLYFHGNRYRVRAAIWNFARP